MPVISAAVAGVFKEFYMWRVTQVMKKKTATYTVFNDETGEYKNCDIDSQRIAQELADFLNGENDGDDRVQ